jgi:hypothetical protein
MRTIVHEFPEEFLSAPTVKGGKAVAVRELVLVDGSLCEVLAWNSVPMFYVKNLKTEKLIQVAPWQIVKIEKVD